MRYVNYDGSVLQEENLSIGLVPSAYSGPIPERPDDYQYKNYEFIGWDKEIKEITGATTYTAQFSGTPQTEEPKSLLELLPSFNNWMQIKKTTYDGNIFLIASKKDEQAFAETDKFSVYIAIYDNEDVLECVSKADFVNSVNNTLSATFTIQSSDNYKIFIWTDKQEPVVEAITANTMGNNKLF